jgi:plasmid maintenance system antidote protein VapI
MLILEEMLEMFATTVQAELNATLHVCESGLQDILTNRSNITSNVVFQFLYGVWLVGISFSF